MDRIDAYAFYDLALKLHEIDLGGRGKQENDVPCATALFPILAASHAMGEILAGHPTRLGVSRAAGEDFKNKIDAIRKEYVRSPGEGRGLFDADPIPAWRWNGLYKSLEVFENVFRAELNDATMYQIPDRGLYSIPKLVNEAAQTFPPDLSIYINDKVKLDFNAAGRCLAFNLLTASGFHVVRAVESQLEKYYQIFSGKEKTLNSWNDYVKQLEAIYNSASEPKPDAKTITLIKQMKDDYRNPVVHPRVVLTEADARILFDNGEAAIMGMAQEICAASKKKSLPAVVAVPAAEGS